MKEELVNAALRLQVAIKMSEEDNLTLTSLRRQAEESRISELVAKKQATEADAIIQTLRIEISSLKRRLKEKGEQPVVAQNSSSQSSATNPSFDSVNVFEQADDEVDSMFANANKISFHPDVGGQPQLASGFQQWKIQKFLYSPDTPAGSLNHDKHTVDLLSEAATRESLHALTLQKETKSSVVKTRRSTSDIFGDKSRSLPHLTSTSLSSELARKKGERGVDNIWTSSVISPTTSPAKQRSDKKQHGAVYV